MQDKNIESPYSVRSIQQSLARRQQQYFSLMRMIEYFGTVTHATNERVLASMKEALARAPHEEITLVVTSTGGPTGSAMCFYDMITTILRPNLVTIGSGDVDSSGVLIFLAGEKRFVTAHTTMLLHEAGRTFEPNKRVTAAELDAMQREDRIKDTQYASVLAQRSGGKLSVEKALELMEANVVLTPVEIIKYGLAHTLLR